MKSKRIISTILAAGISFTCMAACNGGNSSGTSSSKSGSSEPVKLTALFCKHPLTKDVSKMQWLSDLEKKCNVDIKWQQISADWDQKKSTLFASGEIPDLLFNATVSTDYSQFNGLFEDLSPLIDKDAPNIQKMFKEHPELKTMSASVDGKIFSTPKYQRFWPKTNTTMFINKKWLDKLGLKVPTTWDELYNCLVAFKTKDPNGNGKADEIPMDFQPFGAYNPQLLLGSEGIQLTDTAGSGYFVEDGKVKDFLVDDRYKTLIKWLHKCYQAGLIKADTFTNDYSKFQSIARGSGDTAAVGFTFGWEASDRFGNQIKDQYIALNQLKVNSSSTADLRWSDDFYALNYGTDRIVMSANCKDKDAAMKFIDAFYDPEVSMQVLWGGMNATDAGTQKNSDGSYTVLAPKDKTKDAGSWKWENTFADFGPIYLNDSIKITLPADVQAADKEKSIYDPLISKVDPKKDLYPQVFMKYSSEDANTLAVNQANMDNITTPKWAQWISKGDIDNGWDAYVKSLEKAGLDKNLSIRQKAYDAYLQTAK